MLITYTELCEIVDAGVIEGVAPEHINAASIDVTLGNTVWFEAPVGRSVNLAKKEGPEMRSITLGDDPYYLMPGEFVLAQTEQVFNLPSDIAAEFRLKSSVARAGLDAALAMWCDPGWTGSVLTLELKNNLRYQSLMLTKGVKIGQMIFMRGAPVPEHASYAVRGRYNHDKSAQPSKGIQ